MKSFIKKDLLIFLRDRKEIVTSLLLPLVLILIINFAFTGLFSDDQEQDLDLQLAVVNQDQETEGIIKFKEKLIEEASFSDAEAAVLAEHADAVRPVSLLFEYLESDEIKDWITVHELEAEAATEKVKAGEVDGMLIIPADYTAESLYAAFTGAAPEVTLIYKQEKETSNNSFLTNVIQGYLDHLNYSFALQKFGGAPDAEIKMPEGGMEGVTNEEVHPFTMTQYFIFAMAALFALFLASTVAAKTGAEIEQRVFHRILLADSHPVSYFTGKIVSTFCLAWLQIMILFALSHVILDAFPDRSFLFWMGVMTIAVFLSLAISGLVVFFTALALRIKDMDAMNGTFMLIIIVIGTIGGNFVPIYLLPDFLQAIGEWTPNGLSLVMFTEWVQYEDVSAIVLPSIMLTVFFMICTIIGILLYPKRGEA